MSPELKQHSWPVLIKAIRIPIFKSDQLKLKEALEIFKQ